MESRSSLDKRFALLIDADNVSAKYIKPILDELSKYGTITYKRIYGDWTSTLHAKWKDALLDNSITPIQQFSYTVGKNATDSAMIIDAMDILYTNSVEGFCLVSSDSDFTRLASRIRESGLTVIGMGEKKTPTPFRKACDVFTTLELLVGEARRGKEGASSLTIEEVERAVVDIIADNQNNGKSTGLGEVGSRLLKRYPDFDVRSFGTNLLSKLLGEFKSVNIRKEGSNVHVELAEGVEHEHAQHAADKDARANRTADEAKQAENPQVGDSDSAAAAPVSDNSEPDNTSEDEGAAPQGETDASAARGKSRRRRGRRRKSVSVAEEVEHAETPAAGETPASDVAVAAATEGAAVPAGAEESGEPAADAEEPEAAFSQDAAAADATEGSQSASAPAKPNHRRARRAKKGEPASPQVEESPVTADSNAADAAAIEPAASSQASAQEASASVPAEPNSSAEPPMPVEPKPRRARAKKSASASADERPSRKGAARKADEGAAPDSAADAGAAAAGKPEAAKKAPARKRGSAKKPAASSASRKPASAKAATPDEFIRETIVAAGSEGIAVAELARRVRARFKTFKVRDMGYPHMAGYLADVDGVRVFKQGREKRVAAE